MSLPRQLLVTVDGSMNIANVTRAIRMLRGVTAIRPAKTKAKKPRLYDPETGECLNDKTMKAIALVDSLLHDMPLIEKNFDIAKQNLVNDINNNYPSFRGIGTNIATMRRIGFTEDSRTGKAELYKAATMDDVKKYFENNIKNNSGHRVLGIVGNKKKLNLKELQKYGQVVFLKEKDLWRK